MALKEQMITASDNNEPAPFISSQSMHAPANTDHILFKMILIGININEAEAEMIGKAEIDVPHRGELFQPPVISIPVAPKSGNLAILVVAVQYMINRNGVVEMLNDNKKLPCGVLWAGYLHKNLEIIT